MAIDMSGWTLSSDGVLTKETEKVRPNYMTATCPYPYVCYSENNKAYYYNSLHAAISGVERRLKRRKVRQELKLNPQGN